MEHHRIDANGETFHVAIAGEGPPLYLMHGWPETSYGWRKIVPELSRRFTVVTPDIRGQGGSSRALDGYDARNLGRDIAEIAAALGHEEINLVGHDWGAMGAYACARHHPDLVRKLAILEFALPGTGFLEELMTPKQGYYYVWHMGFQSVPDIAQTLITGREREYLTYFFKGYVYDPTAISQEDIDIYVEAMKEFGALRAGLQYYVNWYRMADEVREWSKQKITMPVLALGGILALQDRCKESMEMLAEDVTGGTVERTGHWLAEERPEYMIEELTEFFGS